MCTFLVSVAPAFARFEPVTCKNSFSEEQEIAEGNKVAAEVYRQMPVLPDSDPVSRYVQQLGARLVQFAPLVPGVTHQWPFNFHVVASPEINAFALPGGSVFVNLGTIQAAGNEDQLAGVMAHEISHVVMRHSTCNLGRQQRKGLLYGLGAIGSQILLGDSAAGSLAQTGLGLGQSLDFLHMSRGDEEQADLEGVNILNQAGYDPRGLPQFFEVIRAKYGEGGAQFLSDHPNPGNRTEYVNAEIATLPPVSNPIVNTEAFRRVHALADGYATVSAAEMKAGSWKGSGRYAAGPGAQAVTVGGSGPARPNGDDPERPATLPAGPGGTPAAATTIAPLSPAALGVRARFGVFALDRVTVQAPAAWQRTTDAQGATTLAPAGGAGSFGVAYGAMVQVVPAQAGNSLQSVTDALTDGFVQNNGLTRTTAPANLTVARRPAESVQFSGQSPVAVNGAALRELDTLVTVQMPSGDVLSVVFVSPERDYPTLKPVFERILNSIVFR